MSNQDPVNENVSSQDVTSEYTDLESRLRNLENTETELTRIMEKGDTTEDIMTAFNQLVSIREQIEVIKGQMKYYSESARLSAVSVELIADAAVQPLTVGGWQPVGVAKEAIQALIDTLKFLGNAAIWLIIFILPVLLVLYFIFFIPLRWLWRKIRGKRKAKAPKTPPAPEA
jgi:hypothetical protein